MNKGNDRLLTTQMFIDGHEQNARDGIFRRLGEDGQKLVAARLEPIPDSKLGELAANFDLVVGRTPEDPESE